MNSASGSKGFVLSSEIRALGAGPLRVLPVRCHRVNGRVCLAATLSLLGGVVHSKPCVENTLQTSGAEVHLVESFSQCASSGFQRSAGLSCAAAAEEKHGPLFPPPGKSKHGITR